MLNIWFFAFFIFCETAAHIASNWLFLHRNWFLIEPKSWLTWLESRFASHVLQPCTDDISSFPTLYNHFAHWHRLEFGIIFSNWSKSRLKLDPLCVMCLQNLGWKRPQDQHDFSSITYLFRKMQFDRKSSYNKKKLEKN